MKPQRLLFLVSLGFISFGHSPPQNQQVLGSWEMIAYKYGADSVFHEVPEFIKYVKHVTETHYTWVSFQADGDEIVGAGGGRYQVMENRYIESIDFFYPQGNNLVGTSTTFNFEIANNIWYISGYVNDIQLDPSSGEYVKVDSVKLEEKWRRLL